MLSLKLPNKVRGLTFWLDAADTNTINNGTIDNNQNVHSIRDKVNNAELVNNFGANGPVYAFNSINGQNAIHMPYQAGADSCVKGLTALNLPFFSGTELTMFCVYKPMTTTAQDLLGNQKYVVALYTKTRMDAVLSGGSRGPGGYANRAIYLGDEESATAAQRQNPTGRYIDANTATIGSAGYATYHTYGEHTPSRFGIDPTSLGKTCMTMVRLKAGSKRLGFMFDGNEIEDDFVAAKLPTYSGRGNKVDGIVEDLGSQVTIIIGSPWNGGRLTTAKLYPLEGYFCEFLYFDRYLNDSDFNSVKKYLQKKWINQI